MSLVSNVVPQTSMCFSNNTQAFFQWPEAASQRSSSIPGPPSHQGTVQKSRLTASLAAARCGHQPPQAVQAPAAELCAILQNHVAEEQPQTYLGVSPPVRQSGAANPFGLDHGWMGAALRASRTNLAALKELNPLDESLFQFGGSPMSWSSSDGSYMAAAALHHASSTSLSCRSQQSSWQQQQHQGTTAHRI